MQLRPLESAGALDVRSLRAPAAVTAPRLPVVEITWQDSAHGMVRWMDREEAIDAGAAPLVRSAGYLVADDADGLMVCASHDANADDVAGCVVIPRSAVRRRRTLRA